MERRFQEPGWFTKHVFNPVVALLTRMGLDVAGSRVLEVKGRKTGEWRRTPVNLLVFEVRGRTSGQPRRTPVNLLTFESARFLVAPRGETQWVRNLRAASGEGTLLLGRRR